VVLAFASELRPKSFYFTLPNKTGFPKHAIDQEGRGLFAVVASFVKGQTLSGYCMVLGEECFQPGPKHPSCSLGALDALIVVMIFSP
jgi:hypothetical protein